MKKNLACAVVMLAVVLSVAGCGQITPVQGWTTLIDGAIQADKVTAGKGASVLITKKNYRDIEVYAEFWAADDTNSGICARAPDPANVNTASGAYEIQIWDKNPMQQ